MALFYAQIVWASQYKYTSNMDSDLMHGSTGLL